MGQKDGKYNDGYTLEALHTVHVLSDTFYSHVYDTRCADEFPDVKLQADEVNRELAVLYQLIGARLDDLTGELGSAVGLKRQRTLEGLADVDAGRTMSTKAVRRSIAGRASASRVPPKSPKKRGTKRSRP